MEEEKKTHKKMNITLEKIQSQNHRGERSKLLRPTTVFTDLSSQGFSRIEKECGRSNKQKSFLIIGDNRGAHTLPNHIFYSILLINRQ